MKIAIQTTYMLETEVEVPDDVTEDQLADLSAEASAHLWTKMNSFYNENPNNQTFGWDSTIIVTKEEGEEIASW